MHNNENSRYHHLYRVGMIEDFVRLRNCRQRDPHALMCQPASIPRDNNGGIPVPLSHDREDPGPSGIVAKTRY